MLPYLHMSQRRIGAQVLHIAHGEHDPVPLVAHLFEPVESGQHTFGVALKLSSISSTRSSPARGASGPAASRSRSGYAALRRGNLVAYADASAASTPYNWCAPNSGTSAREAILAVFQVKAGLVAIDQEIIGQQVRLERWLPDIQAHRQQRRLVAEAMPRTSGSSKFRTATLLCRPPDQLALFLRDGFEIPIRRCGMADGCHHTHDRLGDGDHLGHLARLVGAELQHGDAVFFGEAAQGQWQPNRPLKLPG